MDLTLSSPTQQLEIAVTDPPEPVSSLNGHGDLPPRCGHEMTGGNAPKAPGTLWVPSAIQMSFLPSTLPPSCVWGTRAP